MKTYSVNLLSSTDVSMMRNIITDIGEIFESEEFQKFILEKCKNALDTICSMNMPLPEGLDVQYMQGMKTRMSDNEIELYNDSEIDIESKKYMKETTKAKYPSKLSLAQIIEYGIGYKALESDVPDYPKEMLPSTWKLDVNNHGIEGWYYYDDDGTLIWTNGFAGKFIFLKLMVNVKTNISLWLDEYIEKYMKY